MNDSSIATATELPTRLDFVSIQVRDLQASRTFYTETLGFAPMSEQGPESIVFQTQAGAIFAIRKPQTDLDAVSHLGWGVGLWFAHADVEALHEQAMHRGVHIVRPPQDSPFGRMFTLSDPDGYALTFHTSE